MRLEAVNILVLDPMRLEAVNILVLDGLQVFERHGLVEAAEHEYIGRTNLVW
jgi:hypothetical protein